MKEPSFSQGLVPTLYWLDGSNNTIGFLARDSVNLGRNVSLKDTWNSVPGTYFFLGKAPAASDQEFENLLNDFVERVSSSGAQVACVWIRNPDGQIITDRYGTIETPGVFALSGRTQLNDQPRWITRNYCCDIAQNTAERAYLLWITSNGDKKTTVTLDASNSALSVEAACAGFGLQPYNPNSQPPISQPHGGTSTTFTIPFVGSAMGCFQFPLTCTSSGYDPSADPWSPALDIGIRYFIAAPGDPSTTDPVGVVAANCPLLEPMPTTFVVTMDPLRPTDPPRPMDSERCNLAFPQSPDGASGYTSSLTDPLGNAVSLTQMQSDMFPSPRLVFAAQPAALETPEETTYYLTFDGAFELRFSTPPAYPDQRPRLLCGLNPLEYFRFPADDTAVLCFVSGKPANVSSASSISDSPLGLEGTTAWAYPALGSGATGIEYCAQPADAAIFAPSTDPQIWTFVETPVVVLPAFDRQSDQTFPLFGYSGFDGTAEALDIENIGLGPTRESRLFALAATARAEAKALRRSDVASQTSINVNARGIAMESDTSDPTTWTRLGLANSTPNAPFPDAVFTNISGPMMQALESNFLFLVVANSTIFVTCASGSPSITIGDWDFQLWPGSSSKNAPPTIMVYKFLTGRSLRALVEDTSVWNWPEVAVLPEVPALKDDPLRPTQRLLRDHFATADNSVSAAKNANVDSPYARFVSVLDDPDWTGILVFSPPVSFSKTSEATNPLLPLRSALDFGYFAGSAHHVGIERTPFSNSGGGPLFQPSATFALIDYDDDVDIYQTDVKDPWPDFGCKVLSLAIGLSGARTTSFSCRIELFVNRLFGAITQVYPTNHGNNIILNGVYQESAVSSNGSRGTYSFSLSSQNNIALLDSALTKVVVNSAQLVLAVRTGGPPICDFKLGGSMHFAEFSEADVFSFGDTFDAADTSVRSTSALNFKNLVVRMVPQTTPEKSTFTLLTSSIVFDGGSSTPRENSLFAGLPMKLSGFLATPPPPEATIGSVPSTSAPETFGYAAITTPVEQGKLSDPWYGVVYTLDLGSLGGLTQNTPLSLKLLTAWSVDPANGSSAIYVGVQLPGVKDTLGMNLPLQGVLKLGFRTIELIVNPPTATTRPGYMLRFRDLALRLFSISVPPGHNDIYLFGDPSKKSGGLGWYAAYSAAQDKKPKPSPMTVALARRQQFTVPVRKGGGAK